MTTERMDSARLARIDERTVNMDKKLDSHIGDDNRRFETLFTFIQEGMSKIEGRFDGVETKMDKLWDESNQRKGAFNFSKLGITAIWAVFAAAIGWVAGGGK